MSWSKIITYYLLFAFLGGYYLIFETRPRAKVSQVESAEHKQPFLSLAKESSVRELVVRRLEDEVVFQRGEEGWRVIKPAGAPVPSSLVSALIENLMRSKEAEVMAEAPADLSPFGLDLPRSTLVLKTDGKSPPITVFLGESNPTATAVYARLEGSPRVYLLGLTVKFYEELLFEAAGKGREGKGKRQKE